MNLPLEMLEKTVVKLEPLLPEIVFVGGAVLSLYVGQTPGNFARNTDDVDCVIEAATHVVYSRFEARLRALGFKHCMDQGAPICRWWVGDVRVDFMPDSEALGFGNRWYRPGLARAQTATLASGNQIRILALPDFLASKMEAHLSRGGKDLRISKDFDDVIYLLAAQKDTTGLLEAMAPEVRDFLGRSFREVLKDPRVDESLSASLEIKQKAPLQMQAVMSLLKAIAHRY